MSRVTDPPGDQDAVVPNRVSASASDTVQSLVRGIAVIRAFDADHAELTLSDVARRADITRAAAGRFLRTLEGIGYVASDGRKFSLTPRVLELGFSYLSALSIPEIVRPHLETLSGEVDESVSAAVLDGNDIVYVARVPTRRIMSVGITVGTRFPAFATSMGRVLLAGIAEIELDLLPQMGLPSLTDRTITDPDILRAELDRVRVQGWALVDGELEPGLRSVAVPLRDRRGKTVASINISTSATRASVDDILERHLPPLLRTAVAIDAELQLV